MTITYDPETGYFYVRGSGSELIARSEGPKDMTEEEALTYIREKLRES